MSRITIDGKANETFDDDDLDASYRAEFTSDGGVAVHVEVYRGSELLVRVPVAQFGPDEASGFGEGS
jgi:hypothetical protein